ncbi:MAG TPA: guanylate kinase [Bacilli bacterium]
MYQLREKEMIFVFTGPDGSGRKTVGDMVGTTLGLPKVLSYTTRPRRDSEVHGQDYWFIARKEFDEAEQKGEFLESIEIDGNKYGIKNSDVEEMFKEHDFIYLIINTKGAHTLKQLYGDKVTRIFIYIDKKTILERQKNAGADEATIQRHADHYEEAMSYMPQCRHAFENADLAHTVFAVSNTLEAYMNRNLIDKD